MDRTPFLMSRRAALGTLALLPAALPLSAIAGPPAGIAGLQATVSATAAPASQKTLLLTSIQGILTKVLQNQYAQAVALLRSFISLVGKLAAAGSLTGAEATSLISQSNALIALYGGLAAGLIGNWKFDEGAGTVAADSSGRGVNGTLLNGAGWSAAGSSGKALSLAGNPQFVNLGNPAFPTGLAQRSMCGWGKPVDVSGGFGWIFAYGAPGLSQAMFFGRLGADLYGGGYGDDLIVNGVWDTNWHHVALTYDGGTARMYFDGAQVASGPKVWPLSPSVAYIGEQVNGANEFWSGLIDEVRMYDRVLQPNEIAVLAGIV